VVAGHICGKGVGVGSDFDCRGVWVGVRVGVGLGVVFEEC
jgi:hypothetical protein